MRAVLIAMLLLALVPGARAGQQCGEKPLSPEAVRKGLQLAVKTRDLLDQSGARVAVIGRVGADLSRHGLRYSHAGLVQRDHPPGRWRVVHSLNRCGTAESSLFEEGLGNFFFDDPFIYEAVVVVPSIALQQRLADRLDSSLPLALHTVSYSMISHPYSLRYQNSNQWLIELLAATLAPDGTVNSRSQAQSWLRNAGYVPSEVNIGPLQRAGARLFSANVRFDDHEPDERARGRYRVVSVESAIRLLTLRDPASRRHVVRLH